MKKFLLILTNQPYNGTDNAYNALRLAGALKNRGEYVRIFLMNDAVDLARNSTQKPENYDFDLETKRATRKRRSAKSLRQLRG